MISAQRTASSLMSYASTTSMSGAALSASRAPSRRRCRLVAPMLVMKATLPLPFSSLIACSPMILPDA
jgi:hypothetical protein